MLAHTDMLRVSCDVTHHAINLGVVASGDAPSIPAGAEIAALTNALTGNTCDEPVAARGALVEAMGERAAERAIAVCSTFNLMNRLLDGVGAPTPANARPMATVLGFSVDDLPR
jgi:hypothetical protein